MQMVMGSKASPLPPPADEVPAVLTTVLSGSEMPSSPSSLSFVYRQTERFSSGHVWMSSFVNDGACGTLCV